jgi:hypothetical protein
LRQLLQEIPDLSTGYLLLYTAIRVFVMGYVLSLYEWKRPHPRPKSRRENYTEINHKEGGSVIVDWINLYQHIVQRWIFVETLRDLQVP